jgi:hypothetical protein
MSEIRFTNPMGALRYIKRTGGILGISSASIPMIEIEDDVSRLCATYLYFPHRVVYTDEIENACKEVAEDIGKYIMVQMAVAEMYGGIFYHMPRTKADTFEAPLWIDVTVKSVHVIGSFKFRQDEFKTVYAMLATEMKHVDQRYIQYVMRKNYSTIRISGKGPDRSVPKVIFRGVFKDKGGGKLILTGNYEPRYRDFISKILFRIQRLGIEVVW